MHQPFARGVTHLMYVGDYQEPVSGQTMIVGAIGLYAALTQKRAIKIAGIGAASWAAYKVLRSRGVV